VPQTGDKVLNLKKYASSAFEGTDLATAPDEVHVKELVLCVLQSEFCVSNTANSALALGFTVFVAKTVTVVGRPRPSPPSPSRNAASIER
jgi:nicotinamidase-related amidase